MLMLDAHADNRLGLVGGIRVGIGEMRRQRRFGRRAACISSGPVADTSVRRDDSKIHEATVSLGLHNLERDSVPPVLEQQR